MNKFKNSIQVVLETRSQNTTNPSHLLLNIMLCNPNRNIDYWVESTSHMAQWQLFLRTKQPYNWQYICLNTTIHILRTGIHQTSDVHITESNSISTHMASPNFITIHMDLFTKGKLMLIYNVNYIRSNVYRNVMCTLYHIYTGLYRLYGHSILNTNTYTIILIRRSNIHFLPLGAAH